ncbi:MAG: hypothetical protein GY851_00755 [bacterium]|nr:hypothetical protein [bacterium]
MVIHRLYNEGNTLFSRAPANVPGSQPPAPRVPFPTDSLAAADAVDGVMNLTCRSCTPHSALAKMTPSERDAFLEQLSRLLKAGVVGYEVRDAVGPRRTYVLPHSADDPLAGTPYCRSDCSRRFGVRA